MRVALIIGVLAIAGILAFVLIDDLTEEQSDNHAVTENVDQNTIASKPDPVQHRKIETNPLEKNKDEVKPESGSEAPKTKPYPGLVNLASKQTGIAKKLILDIVNTKEKVKKFEDAMYPALSKVSEMNRELMEQAVKLVPDRNRSGLYFKGSTRELANMKESLPEDSFAMMNQTDGEYRLYVWQVGDAQKMDGLLKRKAVVSEDVRLTALSTINSLRN